MTSPDMSALAARLPRAPGDRPTIAGDVMPDDRDRMPPSTAGSASWSTTEIVGVPASPLAEIAAPFTIATAI
jgi:hypothetical protein